MKTEDFIRALSADLTVPRLTVCPHQHGDTRRGHEVDAGEIEHHASHGPVGEHAGQSFGKVVSGRHVQLTDDRHAMVVGVNSTRPLRPQVAVLDPRSGDDDAPALDLEHMPGLGIRRSLRPQALPRSIREAIVPRARVAYFFEPAGADLERAA